MGLWGEPIWVRTLSSHCRGPWRWISIQHGVLVTSCRWYSAPQPWNTSTNMSIVLLKIVCYMKGNKKFSLNSAFYTHTWFQTGMYVFQCLHVFCLYKKSQLAPNLYVYMYIYTPGQTNGPSQTWQNIYWSFFQGFCSFYLIQELFCKTNYRQFKE